MLVKLDPFKKADPITGGFFPRRAGSEPRKPEHQIENRAIIAAIRPNRRAECCYGQAVWIYLLRNR